MERLAAFLYLLGRDELPAGKIERLVQAMEKDKGEIIYTEPLFAEIARKWAARILGRNADKSTDEWVEWKDQPVGPMAFTPPLHIKD